MKVGTLKLNFSTALIFICALMIVLVFIPYWQLKINSDHIATLEKIETRFDAISPANIQLNDQLSVNRVLNDPLLEWNRLKALLLSSNIIYQFSDSVKLQLNSSLSEGAIHLENWLNDQTKNIAANATETQDSSAILRYKESYASTKNAISKGQLELHQISSNKQNLLFILFCIAFASIVGLLIRFWFVLNMQYVPSVSRLTNRLRQLAELDTHEIPYDWNYKPRHEHFEGLIEHLKKLLSKLKIQRDTLSFLSLEGGYFHPDKSSVGMLSQEIRSPINTLAHSITNLYEHAEEFGTHKAQIELLHHNTFYSLCLVNAVMDYSKEKEGRLFIEPRTVDIRPYIDSIIAVYRERFNSRAIEFELSYNPDELDKIFVTDILRLSEVILSLLNQSWLTTERGKVYFECEVRRKRLKNYQVRFVISDTGKGYTKEELDDFQKQYLMPSEQRDPKLGGVILARKILDQLNSALVIHSEKGIGTEYQFNIDLPFIEEAVQLFPQLSVVADQISHKTYHILVVDDNKASLIINERLLNDHGYSCSLASSAQEALEKFMDEKFDLILMDIVMPGMDGLECTQKIRASHKEEAEQIPIIAVSASEDDWHRDQAFNVGMNDFLAKPFTPIELYQIISKNFLLMERYNYLKSRL